MFTSAGVILTYGLKIPEAIGIFMMLKWAVQVTLWYSRLRSRGQTIWTGTKLILAGIWNEKIGVWFHGFK